MPYELGNREREDTSGRFGVGWGGGGATLEYRKVSEERGYYNWNNWN